MLKEIQLKHAVIKEIEEYPDKTFFEIIENWGITGADKKVYCVVVESKRKKHIQYIKLFVGDIFEGTLQKYSIPTKTKLELYSDWDLMHAKSLRPIIQHN